MVARMGLGSQQWPLSVWIAEGPPRNEAKCGQERTTVRGRISPRAFKEKLATNPSPDPPLAPKAASSLGRPPPFVELPRLIPAWGAGAGRPGEPGGPAGVGAGCAGDRAFQTAHSSPEDSTPSNIPARHSIPPEFDLPGLRPTLNAAPYLKTKG